MKEFISILCLLLWPGLLFANPPAALVAAGLMSIASGACNRAENEVGIRAVGGTAAALNAGYVWVQRVQADCSGPLGVANFYRSDTNSPVAILAIYNSDNADLAVDTDRTLVGYSNQLDTSATSGWKTATMADTGDVVSGNYYWIVMTTSDASIAWAGLRTTNSTTVWYKDDNGSTFTSPPATLPATGWSTAAFTEVSAFISIGE